MRTVLVMSLLLTGCDSSSATSGKIPDIWNGSQAKFSEAKAACKADRQRASCVPYMAEGVAVAEVLMDEVSVNDGKTTMNLHGAEYTCTNDTFIGNLNGYALVRLALERPPIGDEYWTQVLMATAVFICTKRF